MERTRVCLDCRTVLGADKRCDGGKRHRVKDLADLGGRAALVNEVWGPPSARRRAREIARAGGTGAGVGAGGQLLDCGGCGDIGDIGGSADLGQIVAVILFILFAAIVAIALYYMVKAIVQVVRRKMNEPRAKGALARPPAFVGPVVRGRVSGAAELTSPLKEERCLAAGVQLAERRMFARDVMLRDAMTCGFDVTLEDGRAVRVPAGRIRLEGDAGWFGAADAPGSTKYLERIDPLRAKQSTPGDADPIPFDDASELLVRPGDAIEIVGALAPVADPTRQGGYREAAMVLQPSGVPCLRVIRADALAREPGPAK